MRSLFAPARLRALAILGGLFALVMSTQDSCTWLEFADEDSVPTLDAANACRIARRVLSGERVAGAHGKDACVLVSASAVAAEVRLGGEVDGRRVCFLRANRWFVVDPDAVSSCPKQLPLVPERVFNLRQEERLEQKCMEALRRQRDDEARGEFLALFKTSIEKWRAARDVPRTCPEFAEAVVDAIDVDLAQPEVRAPWHYLTSDRVESLVTSPGGWGAGAQLRELRKKTPVLLVVDAREKQQPFQSAPGLFRGKVALIDWTKTEVLCEADVEYEQDESAPRSRESIAEFLPDFKQRVGQLLQSTTLSMTNGHLRLADTW